MFITLLCIIAQSWKKCKCSTTAKFLDKLWYIYTKEYYWVINRSKLLIYTQWFRWIDLLIVEGHRHHQWTNQGQVAGQWRNQDKNLAPLSLISMQFLLSATPGEGMDSWKASSLPPTKGGLCPLRQYMSDASSRRLVKYKGWNDKEWEII